MLGAYEIMWAADGDRQTSKPFIAFTDSERSAAMRVLESNVFAVSPC